MPAVVALNVMASPLKSIPLIPLGVRDRNTTQTAPTGDKDFQWQLISFKLPSSVVTRLIKLEYFTTHAFLCCRWCAETLRLSECWGSHPRRPPRLKEQADSVGGEGGDRQTLEVTTLLPRGPTESCPAAPCGPCTT